jgi:hypothetical protein
MASRFFKKIIIPLIHLLLIFGVWSSPFWLNWNLIIVGYFLYLLQNLIFNRCVLSIFQFQNREESFYSHYLHKTGINWPTKKINFTVDYIIPPILIIITLIYQGAIKL